MNSIDNITPEEQTQFRTFIEPFFSKHYQERCYPGLILKQGQRTMLQINVPAEDFSGLLQTKPSTNNDPDSGKNRPEVKGHAEEIKEYIVENAKANKPWIVGTITANVAPKDIEIIELGRGICLVVIRRGVKLDITDGQHRKRAIHELIESNDYQLIAKDNFPITLILEADKRQCQKDFRDMAQTKALDKSLILSFGEYEGRIGITKELIDRVLMFKDKTEKIKASPAIKNKLIYTTNYIARFVSCVFKNTSDDELKGVDVEALSDSLCDCLNEFFSKCPITQIIAQKEIKDLGIDELIEFKEYGVLGTSAGLEVLGRLLHYSYNPQSNYFDEIKISQLSQIDWSRKSSLWTNNIVKINTSTPDKTYRMSNSVHSSIDAVRMVKSTLNWL